MSNKNATTDPQAGKDLFLRKNKQTILNWAKNNKVHLIEARKIYSWNDKEPQACLEERNEITRSITFSRSQNSGGIDLVTLDMIMSWGDFSQFPLRNEQKVLDITRDVFDLVDRGKISEAVDELLQIKGVDISMASKIIGLFDQERFCIYDIKVANALQTLKFSEKPVLNCPVGPKPPEDICSDERWGENYQHLIWTLEVIRDYINSQGYQFSVADVEMALFMMGSATGKVSKPKTAAANNKNERRGTTS